MKLDRHVSLDHVFTVRKCRTLGQGNTISFGGITYTLTEPQKRLDAKTVVEVHQMLSGELLIWHQGKALMLKQTTRPERQQPQKKKASSAPQRKSANDHPWKTTYDNNITKRNTKQSTFQDKMYSQHNTYLEASW